MSPVLAGVHVEDEFEGLGLRSQIDWDDKTWIEVPTTLRDVGILTLKLSNR